MGFADSAVNGLLRLEQRKEAAIALAAIGSPAEAKPGTPDPGPVAAAASPRTLPVSHVEVEHPEIWKIHQASSLADNDEAAGWLGTKVGSAKPEGRQDSLQATASLGEVILRRGYTRRFSRSAISQDQLLSILCSSTRSIPLDFLEEMQPLSTFISWQTPCRAWRQVCTFTMRNLVRWQSWHQKARRPAGTSRDTSVWASPFSATQARYSLSWQTLAPT
jgi:hypothetical protein